MVQGRTVCSAPGLCVSHLVAGELPHPTLDAPHASSYPSREGSHPDLPEALSDLWVTFLAESNKVEVCGEERGVRVGGCCGGVVPAAARRDAGRVRLRVTVSQIDI